MEYSFNYNSIGIIRTPFAEIAGMPIQPSGAECVVGTIEINPDYESGLLDLDGFSHLILIYAFHKVSGFKLQVVPFMDDQVHGIFATRSPVRPNPIGISVVKLIAIDRCRLHFEGADMLDETPLLDIKPFFPVYDNRLNTRFGWLEKKTEIDITQIRSDSRFDFH